MKYIITFYSKRIGSFTTGSFVSTINSFIDLGGDINSDILTINLWKEFVEDEVWNKIESLPFVKLNAIEDINEKFKKHCFKNTKKHTNEFKLPFIGIYFSFWFGDKILKNDYVIIENDLFLLNNSKETIFNFNSNSIQLIQGSLNKKTNTIYSNSLVMFVPKIRKNIPNKIATKILKENFDTSYIWKNFHKYINDGKFELNPIMEYWWTFHKWNEKTVMLHRNNMFFSKEFIEFDQKYENEIIRWENESENPHLDKDSDIEKIISISNQYFEKLMKISKKYDLPLQNNKIHQNKKIENFTSWFSNKYK